MTQKEIFLAGEGDAWFARNRQALSQREFGPADPVIAALIGMAGTFDNGSAKPRLLEVGCGGGQRLKWMNANLGFDCYGVEPSEAAVQQAVGLGVQAVRGTAELLPFESSSFDVVVFGFCLYLCDPEDLFKIAAEADRVLKKKSWLIIHDFFNPEYNVRNYHHREGVFSRKMDYRTMFDWHPHYTCMSHQVGHHGDQSFTDDRAEWVAVSVLRKAPRVDG